MVVETIDRRGWRCVDVFLRLATADREVPIAREPDIPYGTAKDQEESLPPDLVSIAGLPAGDADPCTKASGSGAIKELTTQLRVMHGAAEPFLTTDARVAYWSQVWELEIIRAMRRVESNRKQFYGFRLTAISSAIIVPSLVGLNLSGTGGTTARWLTFSLSLVAALSTAILALFRFGDRWLMYRALSNELINAGWAMVNSPHTDLDKPWAAFTSATNAAISRYNAEYATEVITAAQPRSDERNDGQSEQDQSAETPSKQHETTADDGRTHGQQVLLDINGYTMERIGITRNNQQ